MDEKVGPVSHRWASTFSPLGSDCQATSDAAFSTFVRLRAQAVLLAPEVTILTERKRVAALAAAAHLPSIYSFRECVEEGGDTLRDQPARELATRGRVCGQDTERCLCRRATIGISD